MCPVKASFLVGTKVFKVNPESYSIFEEKKNELIENSNFDFRLFFPVSSLFLNLKQNLKRRLLEAGKIDERDSRITITATWRLRKVREMRII